MRDQFLLNPDIVFLNHGSYGACPTPVFATYQRWQRDLEAQPVEFLGRRAPQLLADARADLAAFVGTDPTSLVFVANATTAINIVVRSVSLKAGDEILLTDHEYGAVDKTWQWLSAKTSATIVHAALPLPLTTPEAVIETLWQSVTERTRAICISHITSATALILPITELCRRARAAGIITIIDGAHAPGQIPLDLATLGADFYAGNCHKWLCAPKGAGFLYAAPHVQPMVEPLVVSWGWQPEGASFVETLEWQGTRDIAAYLAVPDAIRFHTEHIGADVQQACHARVSDIRNRINHLTGLAPICPDDPAWYAQMASIRFPPCDVAALKVRLWDEARIEVPIITWNGQTFVRVSVQCYNTQADCDALYRALERLLPEVALS